ncbi:MAG: hypothetical protein WCC22_04530 [Terriglobales bacterium]
MRKAQTAHFLFTVLICLFLVALLASAEVRPAVYSNGSLKGSYSFLTNKWLTDPDSQTPHAILGIMNFDGLGNATAALTDNNNGTVITATGTGTYSVAKDGTGSISWTDSNGGHATQIIVLDAAGKGFQGLTTSCTGCDTSVYSYTAVKMGASSFSSASLKGNFEWMLTKWTSSQNSTAACSLGRLTFDGVSKVKGTGTDVSGSGIQSSNWAGTYSVNPYGSGSVTVTDQYNNSFTIAFVLNSANPTTSVAKGAQLMVTACNTCGITGAVNTGTATKQ